MLFLDLVYWLQGEATEVHASCVYKLQHTTLRQLYAMQCLQYISRMYVVRMRLASCCVVDAMISVRDVLVQH